MKNKKLNLNELKVKSFVTEVKGKELKGGATVGNACEGSLFPTNCCITEYPTHPCNTGAVCTIETAIRG